MKIRFALGLALVTAVSASQAQSLINLEFRPTTQNILVGQTATVQLWAVATTSAPVDIASMDVNITWDSSIVNPISSNTLGGAVNDWTLQTFFTPPGGPAVNASLADGNARWTGFASFTTPLTVTSSGIHLVNFTFVGQQIGTSTISMPLTLAGSTPTAIFAPTTAAPLLNQVSQSVQINVVPEPATMTALGLGIAALLRRRKSA